MSFLEQIRYWYMNFSMLYGLLYLLFYFILGICSLLAIYTFYRSKYYLQKKVLVKSNHAVGVSIIAPAFNEGATIVQSVKSLLSQEYPKFEVVIINDGSSDDTLEKMIAAFALVKVDFFYQAKLKTQTVLGHFRSTNPAFSKLLVVDKVNGGSKADGSNAGINSARYGMFICTDVDCILRKDTISTLVKPFLENKVKVLASGGMIRISNSCGFKDGMLYKSRFPTNYFARFQELEYTRSFLYGRMAWSRINSLLLVSGGLGMFDKETAIAVGGYWHKSLGEDLDLVLRMRKYMHRRKEDFHITYVPETLCWTEVPSTLNVFLRQRIRWGRGLVQTLYLHREVFLNPKYGRTGILAYPYFVFFEFAVPIVEVIGFFVLVSAYMDDALNEGLLLWVTLCIYLFFTSITFLSVLVDRLFYNHYSSVKEMFSLVITVLLEPIAYHPSTFLLPCGGISTFL